MVAKEGAKHKVRANVICPGFMRTPLVDKQIPEQARTLGITEEDVIKKIMLKDTVDGEFTTAQDVAEATLFFAGFESNALTGPSIVVSHGRSRLQTVCCEAAQSKSSLLCPRTLDFNVSWQQALSSLRLSF